MNLIEKVKSRVTVSKTGNKRLRSYGLFFCPICEASIEKELYGGQRALTCGSSSCIDRHPETAQTPVRSSLYNSWAGMKQRCNNMNNSNYKNYGGRGISYPQKWELFYGFSEDMLNTWKPGLEIDRIDKDGNYSKENCQWLSKEENCVKDRRRPVSKYDREGNHIITYSSLQAAVKAGEATNTSAIGRVALGRRPHYKGYNWQYTQASPFRVVDRKVHPLKGTSNTNNPVYSAWHNMHGRHKKDVCSEWFDFSRFELDMSPMFFEGAHLLRKMKTGIYTKDNCKWVPKEESSGRSRAKTTKQLDKATGELIKIWPSARVAGLELNIDPSSITKVCNGKKKSAGGYCWKN